MKDGDVHEFDSGVVVAISVWVPKKQGRAVYIRKPALEGRAPHQIDGRSFEPTSHRHLFRQVKRFLSDHGRRPSGTV